MERAIESFIIGSLLSFAGLFLIGIEIYHAYVEMVHPVWTVISIGGAVFLSPGLILVLIAFFESKYGISFVSLIGEMTMMSLGHTVVYVPSLNIFLVARKGDSPGIYRVMYSQTWQEIYSVEGMILLDGEIVDAYLEYKMGTLESERLKVTRHNLLAEFKDEWLIDAKGEQVGLTTRTYFPGAEDSFSEVVRNK
jgi:hypothetical protein